MSVVASACFGLDTRQTAPFLLLCGQTSAEAAVSFQNVSKKLLGEERTKAKPCVRKYGEWDRKGDAKIQRKSKDMLANNAVNTSQKQKPQSLTSRFKTPAGTQKSSSCCQVRGELWAASLGNGAVRSMASFSI